MKISTPDIKNENLIFFTPFFMIWELPQNVTGLLVLLVFYTRKKVRQIRWRDHHLMVGTFSTGISLGSFIFYPVSLSYPQIESRDLRHENGHARQSRFLGPLYLIIIGLPSLGRYFYDLYYRRNHGRSWPGYYKGFPEKWADRLGGVTDRYK